MVFIGVKIVGWFYKRFGKPLFFRLDPEAVHNWFTWLAVLVGRWAWMRVFIGWLLRYDHASLRQTLAGITFANPIGLSAGFDKDGHFLSVLPAIGFGYSQVGTITDQPYAGNPPPRLYRLPYSRGIVVYYGLKNDGVDVILKRLRATYRPVGYPVSISIGKTNCRATAETAVGIIDYVNCLKKVAVQEIGDFYTINVSCPNTFGGEPFTTSDELDELLVALAKVRHSKPVFVKLPINLPWSEFRDLLDVVRRYGVAGVIIGNLNKDHGDAAVKDHIPAHVRGGISGKPTWDLSNELIYRTYRYCGDDLIIVGVGGVFSAEDAYEKIQRGASLVQLITGMIYEGPQLIGDINRGLVELLRRDGFSHISEAVGTYQEI